MPGLEGQSIHVDMIAGASFAALQYTAGKLGATQTDFVVDPATAATDKPGGIIQNKPTANQPADCIMLGVSKYKAGDVVHVGDKLTATTGGKLIPTITDVDNYWGWALSECTADGDIGTMFVFPGLMSI